MMTRSMDSHQYAAVPQGVVSAPGFVRVTTVNNIPNTWAIARPTGSPSLPAYNPPAQLPRLNEYPFTPPRYRVQMDPSDPSTWQRQYVFS